MENKEIKRIMIIDDHAVVRSGIKSILERNSCYTVCCEAGNLIDAYKILEIEQPDLILLDYKLPDGDGISACGFIKRKYHEVKIIMLTGFADDFIIKEAFKAGSDGYLLKNIDRKAILDAIENVLSGTLSIDHSLVSNLINIVEENKILEGLSSQETEIISLVALGQTNKEISKKLYIAEKTVRNYLSKIMRKIDVKNRTEAALYWTKLHKND